MTGNPTIADLLDSVTGDRKYLNPDERFLFLEATKYMEVDVKFLLPDALLHWLQEGRGPGHHTQ